MEPAGSSHTARLGSDRIGSAPPRCRARPGRPVGHGAAPAPAPFPAPRMLLPRRSCCLEGRRGREARRAESENHRINHLGWKTPPPSSRTAPRVPNTNAPAVPQPANSRPGAQLSQGAATEGGGDARPPGTRRSARVGAPATPGEEHEHRSCQGSEGPHFQRTPSKGQAVFWTRQLVHSKGNIAFWQGFVSGCRPEGNKPCH